MDCREFWKELLKIHVPTSSGFPFWSFVTIHRSFGVHDPCEACDGVCRTKQTFRTLEFHGFGFLGGFRDLRLEGLEVLVRLRALGFEGLRILVQVFLVLGG